MPLRLLYCDSAGVRRCRVLPDDAASSSVGLTHACMSHPSYGDIISPGSGLSATGESRLTPDVSTIRSLPWCPSHSVALADMLERSGAPWACCPRSALKSVLQRLKQEYGLELLIGFELEFLLLKKNPDRTFDRGGWEPVDTSVYSQSSALDAMAPVLDEMVGALQAMGIPVVQYHAESAPGQFEIATGPAPALEAADCLMLSREAIRGVAGKHQLAVSFAPKPLPDQAGNGCHLHFSLQRGGSSIMTKCSPVPALANGSFPTLSEEAAQFMAGILNHLPALMPFTAPSPNSYQRLRPDCWAGAYATWGYDNREAPLRVTWPGDLSSLNTEFKAFDGSTNPHIGLAAVVSAGMLGMSVSEVLPPFVQGTPGSGEGKPQELLKSGGGAVPIRLPLTLKEGLACYFRDQPLQEALCQGLGPDLVQTFLAVRLMEEQSDPEGSRATKDWAFCY